MMATTTKIKWTTELQHHLLHAMKNYRPCGVEKHFHMMFILEEFRKRSGLNVSGDALWDYIEELYDIEKLGERDAIKMKPTEYSVPTDFKLGAHD